MFMLLKKPLITVFVVIGLSMLFTACTLSSDSSSGNSDQYIQIIDEEIEFKKMEKLNTLADRFYTDVNEGKLEEARAGIVAMHEQVSHIHFQGAVSPEGIEALMKTIISAKQVFTAVQVSKIESIVAAAKVRLAVDALTHSKNPMWLHYYKILKEDGKVLAGAIEEQNQEQVKNTLDQMMNHYSIIRPAVLINRSPSEVNQMDSYLTYLKTQPNLSVLTQYEAVLNELFHHKSSSAFVPLEHEQRNPVYWTAVIASFILSVLTYVGWRKYHVERKLIRTKDKQ